jgi:hypothetical protein
MPVVEPLAAPGGGSVLATTAPPGSGAGGLIRSLSATLTGEVSPSTAPITYYFEYGIDASYGGTTIARILTASDAAQVVQATILGLIPGRTFHYRLVASTSSGASIGQDMTLTTPRITLRGVRNRIVPGRETRGSFRFRLHGSLVTPAALTPSAACRSGGTATIVVTRAGKALAARRLHVGTDCSYDGTIVLTAARLSGRGPLGFRVRFGGNRQLAARTTKTLEVAFG